MLVQGPPGVGKSTLISCLIKHYTRQAVGAVVGPITVVSGKKRRLTLLECPNDLCAMIDAAKVADLVLLVIDAAFGFEMETFEFLMLLQQHGLPKVMGVLTHLDGLRDNKQVKATKKALKHRCAALACLRPGAPLDCLTARRSGSARVSTLGHSAGLSSCKMQWQHAVLSAMGYSAFVLCFYLWPRERHLVALTTLWTRSGCQVPFNEAWRCAAYVRPCPVSQAMHAACPYGAPLTHPCHSLTSTSLCETPATGCQGTSVFEIC